MGRRVLVTGGRDYKDAGTKVAGILDFIHAGTPISLVIHGNYGKTDLAAEAWAKSRGVPSKPVDAEWNKHGLAAGPIRNQRMIDEYAPDLGIVFPGNTGTADCLRRLRRAGIPRMVVD